MAGDVGSDLGLAAGNRACGSPEQVSRRFCVRVKNEVSVVLSGQMTIAAADAVSLEGRANVDLRRSRTVTLGLIKPTY
jgi:hypothetical protein